MIARQKNGATLYLIHILPPAVSSFGSVAYQVRREEMKAKLKELQKRLPSDVSSFTTIRAGHVPETIAELCEVKKIDLVVMTTRGRQGVSLLPPDSSTENTLRVTRCPVLVLHLGPKPQRLRSAKIRSKG